MKMSQHANKMLARQKKLYEHSKDSMNTHLGMGLHCFYSQNHLSRYQEKKKRQETED